MKRLLIPIALFITFPLTAATSRYLVLMRAPLHRSHIRVLNEVAEAAPHNLQTFETIDAFAADLSDDESKR